MLKRFTPILVLVVACWAVLGVDEFFLKGHLREHGIFPRQAAGLPGIVWAPFLHASYQHLAANTLPLLILGGVLCGRSRTEFGLVTVAGIILGGGLTWLFGRNAIHIGASGLIFCYFGYLASLAFFRRTFGTLILSVVCVLGYGGLAKGVVPTAAPISWEGHLFGLVAGAVTAWFATKVDVADASPAAPTAKLR
jgi:membrane associated rhomboid family serine protease